MVCSARTEGNDWTLELYPNIGQAEERAQALRRQGYRVGVGSYKQPTRGVGQRGQAMINIVHPPGSPPPMPEHIEHI